jgi:FMN phosphatase YigB (HAD superfamily)
VSEHDAWLVDLDGTLYYPLWVKLAMAAELAVLGLSSVSTLRSFRREHEHLRDEIAELAAGGAEHVVERELSHSAPSPFHEQLQRTARTLGRDPADVERRVMEWMFRRPGKWIRLFRRRALLEEIATFHGAGGKTALVSDYPATDKLDRLGHSGLVDVVVANGEPDGPRRLKPDPDGYLAAARRLGVEPARCLVLGDRDDADGAAARSAGMQFRLVK